jgi:hypothetical protein
MAIDTFTKRASVWGFNKPYRTVIIPNGSIDQGDRQTALSLYSGMLAGVAIGGEIINFTLSITRKLDFNLGITRISGHTLDITRLVSKD